MKGLRRVGEYVFSHFAIKLAALFCAFVGWTILATQDLEERTFVVPLQVVNKLEGTRWSRSSRPPREVVIRILVRGRSSEIVENADFEARIDLKGVSPDESVTLKVSVDVPRQVILREVDPDAVRILLLE